VPASERPAPAAPAQVDAEGFVAPVVLESRPAAMARSMQMRWGTSEMPQVLVKVDIDAQGRPSNAEFVRGDVGRFHRGTAVRAVQRWTFEPARRDGVAVASTIVVPVHYAPNVSRVEDFWADAMRHPTRPGMPAQAPSAALRGG
jgi:TonB family protein